MKGANVSTPAFDDTESIMPLVDFRATPFAGSDKEFSFKAGILSTPVPSSFAEQMRADGRAAKK